RALISASRVLLLSSAFWPFGGFVSQRHFRRESAMRLKHLYYRTNSATVSKMELRHLRYFMAVGEEQHYNRAAQRLRVAQPALSRQIQDLEEELGFTLFDRLPRGVRLSLAGQLFLEDARRILLEISD